MSRIADPSDLRMIYVRQQHLPIISTTAATLLTLLPIVVSSPFIPDFAFLVLIAWRLLRPEMWTATTALPLGLFDDLITGHPLGQSMALWTIVFLAFDAMETRLVWRDYLTDWLAASLAICFFVWGGWYISRQMGSEIDFAVMLPQLGLSILAYPIIARIVLALDRRRLSR